jgi:uncharacterized membrane protein
MSSKLKPEEETHQEHTAELERWIAAGLGHMPYVGTREAMEALPEIGKAEIQQRHPHHWERVMGRPEDLPAELQLRFAKGELQFTDVELMEAAGFVAAGQLLRGKAREAMQAAFEANHKAQMEAWAEDRVAQEEASQQEQARLQAAEQHRALAAYMKRQWGVTVQARAETTPAEAVV